MGSREIKSPPYIFACSNLKKNAFDVRGYNQIFSTGSSTTPKTYVFVSYSTLFARYLNSRKLHTESNTYFQYVAVFRSSKRLDVNSFLMRMRDLGKFF